MITEIVFKIAAGIAGIYVIYSLVRSRFFKWLSLVSKEYWGQMKFVLEQDQKAYNEKKKAVNYLKRRAKLRK